MSERQGRANIVLEVRELVRSMSRTNLRCGVPRIPYSQNTRMNVTLLPVTPETVDPISRLILAQDMPLKAI